MGRDERRLWVHVMCTVSRHNSPQDAEDDALCDELGQRMAAAVRPIVDDPRYAGVFSFADFGPDAVAPGEERGLYLTDREVAILAHSLVHQSPRVPPVVDSAARKERERTWDALARLFTPRATVARITRERVRQIEGKLTTRLRMAAFRQWGPLEGAERSGEASSP